MTTTPAIGRAVGPGIDLGIDSPSSILAGEAFLERVFNAYRSATSETGANVWNTTLLIGWDEPGGTYDHVPPGPVPPPDPAAPAGEFGFTFDAPATAFRRSLFRHGSSPDRSTTRSTDTPL